MKLLKDAPIEGKKIFLRADFNVPLQGEKITDDNRITAVLPTIKFLLDAGAEKIKIASHLGKPEGKSDPKFSLLPVANRLAELLQIKVTFTEPVDEYILNEKVSLLENLRFNVGEEANDPDFAKKLAEGSDIYVNDAFAVSHRANASVEAITRFLPSYGGLLLEKEIENLSKIKDDPEKPFVVIIGGVKVKDKAGVINKLAEKADKILLGGGVANTFMKASGKDISKSVYDEEMVFECREMLQKLGKKIALPVDDQKEYQFSGSFKIMDIGRETRKLFAAEILKAKTVFWNGSLGYGEDGRYRDGMRDIAKAMNEVKGMTVIAGGDTVGFVKQEKLDQNINFISTGGGASLDFLAGEKLPGIEALN